MEQGIQDKFNHIAFKYEKKIRYYESNFKILDFQEQKLSDQKKIIRKKKMNFS